MSTALPTTSAQRSARSRLSARRGRRPLKPRELAMFLVLAGPNVVLLLVFVYRPLVLSFYYSTLQWNLGSQVSRFVGFDNYRSWFSDPMMPGVMRTTAVYTAATVGGSLVIGLALALLLDRKLFGRGLARTVAFAPYVLFGVAVGMLWLYIFDPRYGLLATLLRAVGVVSPSGTRRGHGASSCWSSSTCGSTSATSR